MNKKILLIGGNYTPELTGIGKYNGEMIDWLSKNGNDCTVITTYPYYPQWQIQKPYTKKRYWFSREVVNSKIPIKISRCPHYVPAKPTGLTRMVCDVSIFISFAFAICGYLFRKKFDIVLVVVPPFTLGLLGSFYTRIKGGKLVYHIQDLQVDAAWDLQIIKSKRLIKMLFAVEAYILKRAHVVSTISKGMTKKIAAKCKKNVVLFPNWVDIEGFYPIIDTKGTRADFGFTTTDKIVLYSGAIGEKQGLETILEAARFFKNQPTIKFVICGSGPYKNQLMELAKNYELSNVSFLPLQPNHNFNCFLNMADIHLVIQKGNASDLVMPSKLSTILAVGGVSIVTANANTSLYEIVSENNLGVVIKPEDQASLNNSISTLINSDISEMSKNARNYAERYLLQNSILCAFDQYVLKDEIQEKEIEFEEKTFV